MTDLSAWPALVLTAGLGTRLAPLSDVRAKAALPVAGRPLIARILAGLRAAGVRRVVLNLHHRPETITRLVGDGSPWDLEVRYSWEPTLLGSAGGPSRAMPLLDAERFFIVNGDTLTDCSLPALAARHHASQALVTLAVVPGDVDRYGGVAVDDEDRVAGFVARRPTARNIAPVQRTAPIAPITSASARERSGELRRDLAEAASGREGGPSAPDARQLHFLGVQAVEAGAFAGVADDRPSETIRTLYPQLLAARAGAVVAFRSHASFLDIGTPRDYFETVAAVARAEGVALDRGEDVRVADESQLTESIVWDRVTIEPGARLRRCIVADGVVVPPGNYEEQVFVATADGRTTVTAL